MRYSVEHQRNIAFDLLLLRRNGSELADGIDDVPIIIYGYYLLSQEIYHDLINKRNVLCFIDRECAGTIYENKRVFSIDDKELETLVQDNPEVVFLVTVPASWTSIKNLVNDRFPQKKVISIYSVTAELKLKNCEILGSDVYISGSDVFETIIAGKEAKISAIVFVCTLYQAYVALHVVKDLDNILFISQGYACRPLFEKISKQGIPCISQISYFKVMDILCCIAEFARCRDIPIYGFDHEKGVSPFLENRIKLIEDGIGNYDHSQKYLEEHCTMADDHHIYYPFGIDDWVEEIYLTGIKKIPDKIHDKVNLINLVELEKKKSKKEKVMISEIFNFSREETADIVSSGKDILFLTSYYTEGEYAESIYAAIDHFRNILKRYSPERILIKPHPQDRIDYGVYFPEYTVLEKSFPVQLMINAEIPFKMVIANKLSMCIPLFKDICTVVEYS